MTRPTNLPVRAPARVLPPCALALALLLGACTEQPTSPEPPAATTPTQVEATAALRHLPGRTAGMVFYSARTGDLEIYGMDANGENVRRITDSPGEDTWPDISPDGRFVAFASQRTGNREIFVTDLRTGSVWNVSNSPGDDNWPRWSPDGRWIAFHSNRDGGNYDIHLARSDGEVVHRVTSDPVLDQWPDWSPDGRHIAFRRGMDIYVIDLLRGEPSARALTNLPLTLDQMPAWSPDGKLIAFMSLRAGYCSVFVMSAAGDTPSLPAVNLTPKNAADANGQWCSRAPAWSSDGSEIYFMSFRPETGGAGAAFNEIFAMKLDGSVRRLTTSPGEDGGPRAR